METRCSGLHKAHLSILVNMRMGVSQQKS